MQIILKSKFKVLCLMLMLTGLCITGASATACAKDLIVGMLLAGAHDDNSYNQFHLDAARQAATNVGDIKIIYIDYANPIIRPADVTIPAMIDDLVQKGATVIIANAYEMELGVAAAAPHYPEIMFIQIDGDEALVQAARSNIVNVTVMFDCAQMLAGFAAGMASPSGKIAYLGGSPNSESYRQISAAYLGAKYAWETARSMPAKDFRFRLKWMGNWFDNLSPQEDTKASVLKLFDNGSDVIIGGNYNNDILVAAEEAYNTSKRILVTAVAGTHAAQDSFPFLVGLSYYNWRAIYEELFTKVKQNDLSMDWLRFTPDLAALNSSGDSNVGFIPHDGLDITGKKELARFTNLIARSKLNLFKGPLNYQDGSTFVATDQTMSANTWRNMPQLLEGIEIVPYMQILPANADVPLKQEP